MDGDTKISFDVARHSRRPSKESDSFLMKSETRALVVFLRSAAFPLFSDYCSVPAATIERMTAKGSIRKIHRAIEARDIIYSAAPDMEHFEVIQDDDCEIAIQTIAKHRGTALASASLIAFPEMVHASDALEVLVHLCTGTRASAIL